VIRYGVRGPVAGLDPQSGILLRQALIRRLRVLVPGVFGLAFLSGVAVTLLGGRSLALGLRCAGLLFLVGFISITLAGTVPINAAALTWDAMAPPPSWRVMVRRWERLDTARTWAAIAAFGFFLAALTLHTA
jgi:uncharacterized membrane protein